MSKLWSSLFWKFTERMSSQLVTFVVSIVLARLLSPNDYGAIALITVFITISNVLITSGFSTALIQKKEADQTDFSSVFFFNLLFGCLIYVILFFCAPAIASFYGMPVYVMHCVCWLLSFQLWQLIVYSKPMFLEKCCLKNSFIPHFREPYLVEL